METTETVEPLAVFDPTQVNLDDPRINAVFARAIVDGKAINEIRVNWVTDYSKASDHEDNIRPAWADLPIDQRVFMTLPDRLANVITRQVLTQPNGYVQELPCPPYEFDRHEGKLRIKAGAFQKSGSKAEWTEVIDQMQREVKEMPDAIDTTDLPEITLNLEIRATMTQDVSVETLLEGHDEYEDGMWSGDRESLESALQWAVDDYEVETYDIDLSYAEWDEVEITSSDLDYCVRQIEG